VIRKLRRKFILINLTLVSLVLVVVFAILVASNARRLSDQSTAVMNMALEWRDGEAPPRFVFDFPQPEQPEDDTPRQHRQSFPMVPVFVITLNDGEITSINDGGRVDVSEEAAEQAVEAALDAGTESGVLRSLGLRFQTASDADGALRIAFADRSWETQSLTSLILTCLLVWALALLGFFFISLFLSSLALRPAERAWQQQRQFVADASHELKTPLTVILANSGILLAHRVELGQQAKWVEYIQEEAGQMKGLVEDLLFLAKSDASRCSATPSPVPISDIVTSCLLPFESVAFEAEVTLDSHITPGLFITGDEGQLRRLVMILLDNAVKYAGSGGSVSLSLTNQPERLRLSVHNTGAPIPPEHLPHLFERFFRADASRDRAQGGYGLGLAIAKSITELHRGRISVSSTAQEGTTFTVLLPSK
jgi:two-component system sensor histidine kinase CiaH